ncbi:class I SAM-dependent methyltransferase [Campylobacter pinnipediorum]|uniref:class I SAM-dependent methyltransferase n=1 Tax=Campylobacter pinnipediorum TaxID=1965231 RepID=UPI00084D9E6C|nr:class I SAM-dependent methyltransferase [Campylobacter pinnipediorum]
MTDADKQQDIVDELSTSYDEMTYKSNPFTQCSPLKLEACAKLLSLDAKPSENAKILEIGCSFGGNLIPFSLHNPNATIVGIDLSREQIKQGKEIVSNLELQNLELICGDITKADEILAKYGKFDYIICHGVYSWVPDFVKEAILKTIKDYLAKNGVAYVSYNVYPGWKFKEVIKDYMQFVSKDKITAKEKLKIAKNGLDIYENYLQNSQRLESKISLEWTKKIKGFDDSYMAHEYLETINDPFYFRDFANDLSKHSLEYLCEIDMNDIFAPILGDSEGADEFMKQNFKDRIDEEQFMDFATFRAFRQSLIVHSDTFKELKQDIGVNEISKLHIIEHFTKDNDIYTNKKKQIMPNAYGWLYELFNSMYPSSINLADVLTLIDPKLKLDSYLGFIELLKKDTVFLSKPYETIRYEINKTRLKPELVPYIRYFLKTDNPVIGFATEFNELFIDTKKYDFYIMLKFDGNNTIYDIADDFIKYLKNNNITPKDDNKKDITSKSKLNKFALEYVMDTENILAQMHFFEEF